MSKTQNPLTSNFPQGKQASAGVSGRNPWLPGHLCASVERLQVFGQVSWLRVISSQWRDRAGISPASLFSPTGAPIHSFKRTASNVSGTLTRHPGGVKLEILIWFYLSKRPFADALLSTVITKLEAPTEARPTNMALDPLVCLLWRCPVRCRSN